MPETKLDIHHYADASNAHSHDQQAQLVFGLNGSLELEFGQGGGRVQHGNVAIIAPGERHAFFSPDQGNCLVLDIDSDLTLSGLTQERSRQRRLLEQTRLLPLSGEQSGLVRSLAPLIVAQPHLADASAALLIGALLGEPPAPARLPLTRLNHYIDGHLAHPLGVADLATVSGLSASRLNHWCLRELGCTPLEYVRQRRLQRAQQLVMHTERALTEIAAECGYSSQSAFTQAFRRYWQATPSQLRQQQ
tara:strand:- start:4262 stop:5005 length:744 start_codon:yes stop_codon:yes gene_type:complete